MSPPVRSELRKLVSCAGARELLPLGAAVSVAAGLLLLTSSRLKDGDAVTAISDAGFGGLFALVFGVVLVTTESRHRTRVLTALACPDRRKVVAAKATVAVGASLAAGVMTYMLQVGMTFGWFAAHGRQPGVSLSHVLAMTIGGTIATRSGR